MSDSSASPTPSQENLANTMDATMYNAIDTFMANEEQSYDSFMEQFSHLTKEDVKAEMLRKREAVMKKMQVSTADSISEAKKCPEGTCDHCPAVVSREEELEEEVLEKGTVTSIMTGGVSNGPTKSGVKFDNFIELEEDADEDVLPESEYVASFAAENSSVQATERRVPTDSEGEITPAASENLADSGGEVTPEASEDMDDSDILNPGEVEDVPLTEPVALVTSTLDFTSRISEETPHREPNDLHQKVCSDEVEPFSLDADFDYDNVILTPKYSDADVELMRTLTEQNRENTDTQQNET